MSGNRRNAHGPDCPCGHCRSYYARQSPPKVPPLPPMPSWTYSLSYALIQVGDFFRVLSDRYAPPKPATEAPATSDEDEDDVARRAASGEFNQ